MNPPGSRTLASTLPPPSLLRGTCASAPPLTALHSSARTYADRGPTCQIHPQRLRRAWRGFRATRSNPSRGEIKPAAAIALLLSLFHSVRAIIAIQSRHRQRRGEKGPTTRGSWLADDRARGVGPKGLSRPCGRWSRPYCWELATGVT